MKTLLLLFLIQGLALFFLIIPYDVYSPELIKPFFLSDKDMSLRFYIWVLCERINEVLFIYCIKINIHHKYQPYVMAFMLMSLFRVIEFMMNYNAPWFHIGGYTLGLSHIFITFKAIIISVAIWEQSK